MKSVYVVTMYFWGSRDRHSYVLRAYSNEKMAMRRAEEERLDRGATKYMPEILKVAGDKQKIILPLITTQKFLEKYKEVK